MFFNSPLKFTGDDFTYLRDEVLANECCEVKFYVEKLCDVANSVWSTYWSGYFTHSRGNWNLSHCSVEMTFEPDDYYRCLLYGYEDKHTIFETLQYFERLECCDDLNQVVQGGSSCDPPCVGILDALQNPSGDEIGFDESQMIDPCDGSERGEWQLERHQSEQITFTNEPVETFHICVTWIREVAITADVDGDAVEPSGTGWTLREAVNYNGLPGHKWTRLPYGGIYYGFSDYTVIRDCDGVPCIRTWGVNFPETPDSTTTQKSLEEVAEQLAFASCGLVSGFRSDFFEINAPGDTPGFVSGTNYVTGAASQVNNIRVQQISAYLTVISDSVQEIYSDLSLKDLLDALKTMFNCKWFVDSAGYVRMEHISWFNRTVAIDSTTGAQNIRLNKSRKQFKFDNLEIPVRETFTFVYQGYKDFIGKDIKYNSPCVNLRKTVSHSVPKFSTDLQHIRDRANDLKDFNSFLLLACDVDDAVLTEAGLLTTEDQLNGHLSWANLHYNYHRYDRWLASGNMNEVEESFLSTKKTKRQVPILYTGECCVEIEPMTDLVTTELGDGQIDKLTKDNRDELFTIELIY